MKAFILPANRAQSYAFIRAVISIVLVTAGPVSETELSVCLDTRPLITNNVANQQWNNTYTHHITKRTHRLGSEKHFNGLRRGKNKNDGRF